MPTLFKDFSNFSSGSHLVNWIKTISAISIGSHLGNIPEKFESHWPKGLGGDRFQANYSRFSVFSSGCHFVYWSGIVLAILVQGHLSNNPMKFE